MSDQREILAKRITEARLRKKISARALSMQATGKPDGIRDMLRRNGLPNSGALSKYAEILGTTTDWLLGLTENEDQPLSEVSFTESRPRWGAQPPARLPVYGTGYCDDLEVQQDGHLLHVEQTLFEPTNVVAMISRPPALLGMDGVYGIFFHGSSMEPRFFQGEIGVVTPNPPPGPGDFVVVQINDGNGDDVVHVLVKQLVRSTSAFVELRQFNPEIVFRLERRRVTRMHRIAMSGEPALFH